MSGPWKGRSESYVSSKSLNQNVLNVYTTIFRNAYSDSDFWSLGGADVILDSLYDFNEIDLLELKKDISNWTLNEIEIFRFALEYDYSASHDDLLPQRSYLYGYILTLASNYLSNDVNVAFRLINGLDLDFLAQGYIIDKNLLELMQKTLENAESLSLVMNYIKKERFDWIKITIQKLYDAAK